MEHGQGAPTQPPLPSHMTPSGQSREAGAAGTSARVSDDVSFRAADPEAGGDGRGECRFLPRRAASVRAVGRPWGGVLCIGTPGTEKINGACSEEPPADLAEGSATRSSAVRHRPKFWNRNWSGKVSAVSAAGSGLPVTAPPGLLLA